MHSDARNLWPVTLGVTLVAALVVSCGGGGASAGTALTITAPALSFDTACLATLPDQPFTVKLDNQDSGVDHNFLISTAFSPGSPILFQGDPIRGPGSVTYDIGALDAGTYSFECSIHPGFMHGTFIVAPAGSSSVSAEQTV